VACSSNGANHLETFLRVYASGQAKGEYVYHNDSMVGFCGGIVIGVLNAENQIVQYFTPPSGCINGKIAGGEVTRNVDWGDEVTNANLQVTQQLRIAAYPTQGENQINIGSIEQAAQQFGVPVAQAIGALG
jgi:alpha-L-arabinofuranosidase